MKEIKDDIHVLGGSCDDFMVVLRSGTLVMKWLLKDGTFSGFYDDLEQVTVYSFNFMGTDFCHLRKNCAFMDPLYYIYLVHMYMYHIIYRQGGTIFFEFFISIIHIIHEN